MEFVLWLDPDLDEDAPPEKLLQWALDSIEGNPDLVWTIKADDGRVIADNVGRVRVEATCRHCDRRIIKDGTGRWVDPEAGGDDSIWRETCDENHEDRVAAHEPKLTEADIDKALYTGEALKSWIAEHEPKED